MGYLVQDEYPVTPLTVDFSNPLITGLTRLWNLNAGAGTPFEALRGYNSERLDLKGSAVWSPSPTGTGIRVATSSDYLQLSYNDDRLQIIGDIEFTLSVILYKTSASVNNGGFFCYRSASANGAWRMMADASGNIQFQFRTAGVTNNVVFGAQPGIGRHHLVITRKTGGNYFYYLNGVLQGTASNATAPIGGTGIPFAVGIDQITSPTSMPGIYQQVALWLTRALTPAEIWQFYRHPYTLQSIPSKATYFSDYIAPVGGTPKVYPVLSRRWAI